MMASIGTAIEAAGLLDARALHFREAEDTPGVLVGVGGTAAVDGRSNPDARSLKEEGDTIRVTVPPHLLEDVLGITSGKFDSEHPPRVVVLAGDGVIAFEPVSTREVAVDTDIS
jgi:hypothetical protein